MDYWKKLVGDGQWEPGGYSGGWWENIVMDSWRIQTLKNYGKIK